MPMIRPCHPFRLILLLLLTPTVAIADTPLNSQLTNSILLTTGMLIVVIACFLGLAWLTRRLQATHTGQQRSLKIVESIPVGRNEKICIIKAGSNYKVVGVTAHQITLLDTLDQVETGQPANHKNQAWNWAQSFLKKEFLQSNSQ